MFYFLFLILSPVFALPLPIFHHDSQIQIGVSRNRTLRIPGLIRAAVANTKIVRVRAIPPDTLLLTAMKVGKTSVQVWAEKAEREIAVTVIPGELYETSGEYADPDVVKVAVEFLELNSAFSRNLGVRWPEAIHFSGTSTWNGFMGSSGLNHTVVFSSAKAWIAHLVQEGWAKILASPDLYVRLGEEAVFRSGGEFPVPTTSENYGRQQRHVEWKPYGLTVKVRPQSGDRIHIRSDIRVDISEINSSYSAEGIPALSIRNLETKMDSLEGETVVLSGLIRQSSSTQKSGLPGLGSIPILGVLFAARGEHQDETEVSMAVTFSMMTRSRTREQLEQFYRRYQKEP